MKDVNTPVRLETAPTECTSVFYDLPRFHNFPIELTRRETVLGS